MTVAMILQARTSSRRLPGKVLLPILGQPMLARQIERLKRVALADRIVVATSDRDDDAAVAAIAHSTGVDCHRGSLDDVLDRYYRAALPLQPDLVVRVTGDCPLADAGVIDGCIRFLRDGDFDYASNALRPTWPDGLDVEVMTFAALRTAWERGTTTFDREHVTPFIHRNPALFRLGSYEAAIDRSVLRWTVDEPADFAFVNRVYEALYPLDPQFDTAAILALLERDPALGTLNTGIERNAGMKTAS